MHVYGSAIPAALAYIAFICVLVSLRARPVGRKGPGQLTNETSEPLCKETAPDVPRPAQAALSMLPTLPALPSLAVFPLLPAGSLPPLVPTDFGLIIVPGLLGAALIARGARRPAPVSRQAKTAATPQGIRAAEGDAASRKPRFPAKLFARLLKQFTNETNETNEPLCEDLPRKSLPLNRNRRALPAASELFQALIALRRRGRDVSLDGLASLGLAAGIAAFIAWRRGLPGAACDPGVFTAVPLWSVLDGAGRIGLLCLTAGLLILTGRAFPPENPENVEESERYEGPEVSGGHEKPGNLKHLENFWGSGKPERPENAEGRPRPAVPEGPDFPEDAKDPGGKESFARYALCLASGQFTLALLQPLTFTLLFPSAPAALALCLDFLLNWLLLLFLVLWLRPFAASRVKAVFVPPLLLAAGAALCLIDVVL
ncbi:MAG: hypothetical protein LBS65_01340 [Desulfovibrio sp.]|jgi:hypothetical protein|nr:hypothetical protein [Desulfovibrio sp.]